MNDAEPDTDTDADAGDDADGDDADDYHGGRMNSQMTSCVCLQCFVRHFNLLFLSSWIKTKRKH